MTVARAIKPDFSFLSLIGRMLCDTASVERCRFQSTTFVSIPCQCINCAAICFTSLAAFAVCIYSMSMHRFCCYLLYFSCCFCSLYLFHVNASIVLLSALLLLLLQFASSWILAFQIRLCASQLNYIVTTHFADGDIPVWVREAMDVAGISLDAGS